MKSLTLLPLITLFAACSAAGVGTPTPATSTSDTPPAFEYRAVPGIAIEGEPIAAESFSEYADQYDISAGSMAVFKDGKMIYQEFKGDGIGPNSVFQAASLAKAVASATITTLAMREGISLDEDVSKYITSFDLTSLEGYEAPVTLRQLLSHTSGANVEGFQGYPQSAELPNNLDVILGSEKSNSKRVAFSKPVGKWSYSGGGYQIAQAFAEDVSGLPFDQLAQDLVLDPVGMTRSRMTQTFDRARAPSVTPVTGVERKSPVEGGWHNYPEIATAGLWTTAEDYGLFLVAVMAAADGERGFGLAPEIAKEMLTIAGHPNPIRGYGLGFGILPNDDGTVQSFEHHGKNFGYLASFSAFPKDRALSIVLTNNADGYAVATDTNRGFGEALGYKDPVAKTLTRAPFTDTLRDRCLGTYNLAETPDATVFLKEDSGELVFENEVSEYPLVHLGDGAFIYLGTGTSFQCSESEQGVTLSLGSSTIYKKR
jgi:CubicO group peptidase (beta-lactamase class C family)